MIHFSLIGCGISSSFTQNTNFSTQHTVNTFNLHLYYCFMLLLENLLEKMDLSEFRVRKFSSILKEHFCKLSGCYFWFFKTRYLHVRISPFDRHSWVIFFIVMGNIRYKLSNLLWLFHLALQTKGFLGNEAADAFQALSCLLKVKVGNKPNLIVLRKKGMVIDLGSCSRLLYFCLISIIILYVDSLWYDAVFNYIYKLGHSIHRKVNCAL